MQTQSHNHEPLKIAIVSQAGDSLLPPNQGSVAICTRALARALFPDHDVRVYGVNRTAHRSFRDGAVRYHLFRETRFDAFCRWIFETTKPLHRIVNRGYPKPLWATRLLAPSYRNALARHMAKDPVDVILLQHSATPLAAIRRHLPGARVVLQLHAPLSEGVMSSFYKTLLTEADAITGVSQFVANDAARRLGRVATVVRNGCERDKAPDVPIPANQRSRTIVFAGAVSPEKGVHHLIDAFNLLCETRSDIRLEIIGSVGARRYEDVFPQGDSPRLKSIEPMFFTDYGALIADRLSPAARARTDFLGRLPWAQAVARISQARVLALPSVWDEGFGLPVLEAMTFGTVPVVSPNGGLPELVQDGETGHVVDPEDTVLFAETLATLADDDERWSRLSNAAHFRAKRDFTWERAAEDFVLVARKLLSDPSR